MPSNGLGNIWKGRELSALSVTLKKIWTTLTLICDHSFSFSWGQNELIDYYCLNPGKQGYSPFPRTGCRAATGKTNRKVCKSPL